MSPRSDARSDSALKVLWLIKGLGPGGAERLVVQSARLRDAARVDGRVAYLLPWKDTLVAELERDGVATACFGARSSWDPRWLGRLRRSLVRNRVDIVHVHSPIPAIGARLVVRTLSRRQRPRIVTTEHNVWSSHVGLTRVLNTATANLDDARTAVSVAVRDSMPVRLRADTEVVRYGVEVSAVRAAGDARDAMRAELGLAGNDFVIGTVANLRANKAYPELLAAARLVCDELPDARFMAVGQGPLEAEVRAEHARLGLGDRFTLLGYRVDATRVMATFDVFCLASHHEGLPIAMMEALVLGLPVVATDVGGNREIVEPECNGLLVPPGRPRELARALLRIARDAGLRSRLAAAAAASGEGLAVEQAIRRTEALYAEVSER
jgi:glycosyltransferase involved in cell wall biosynthesis